MFALLKHILEGQNQFASGGLVLMLLGSAGVFLRELPATLWHALVRQTTLMITVKDDDAAFQWVKRWFLDQQFLKRIRRVDLDTTLRGSELSLIPAPGDHWFWYRGRLFRVTFHRSDDTKGPRQRRVEALTFETLGRDQALLRRLVDDVVATHRKQENLASALYMYDDYWNRVQAYAPRLLDSIILKPGEKEHLVQDLERFRATRQRYRRLGVPYHRGYLLYGPPGTGKTSLVSALAAEFGMSIYAVNLTELNDRTLKAAVNEVPENSVILFEDIDCMRAGHKRRSVAPEQPVGEANVSPVNAGVTLSGLLNVLDGFHAPENVVFIMTTNHAETLDPALLRPGRIDYKLFLGEVAEMQKAALYRRFFPQAPEAEARQFAEVHGVGTMAEFQGLLLRLEEGADAAELETSCRS
jgi:chaperone BCS1